MVQLRSWMIPGLAWEHSSPWRVPVEKQQQHNWQIPYCECCFVIILPAGPKFSLKHWAVGNSIILETLLLPILLCAHMPPNTTKVTIFSQQWLCCGGKRRPNKAAKIDVNALNVLSNILPCFIESCNEQELNNFADNVDFSSCDYWEVCYLEYVMERRHFKLI